MNSMIKNFEEIIGGIFIVITVSVVILNVVLRYFFNIGLYWVEEVATTAFVWSVFIGVSAAYKRKMHIGIDILTNILPQTFQPFVAVVVDLLMIVINGYIFYLAIIFTRASSIKPTAVLGISSAWVSSAILVGFALVTFHAIRFLIADVTRIVNAKSVGGAQ